LDHETKVETVVAGIKVVPAVSGSLIYALTLQEWVAIVTIAYVVLQIGLLIPKYYNGIKKLLKKK